MSYIVLGMTALRGPSTPYEIEQAVRRSVGHFWPFAHSQLYREPARLSEAGFMREERETGGRRRRTYTITEAGRQALREWLEEPAADTIQIRDMAELKLFFSEIGGANARAALAREQAAAYRERLGEYEALREGYWNRPELASRFLSLEIGLRVITAIQSFWTELAEAQGDPDRVLTWPDSDRDGRRPRHGGRHRAPSRDGATSSVDAAPSRTRTRP